ncbi:MAG: polysaccharide biosynthesis protein, partial [Clostridia bacterium]|nr:polysaccharide biosynthesis protein [Clostridia bacterium]
MWVIDIILVFLSYFSMIVVAHPFVELGHIFMSLKWFFLFVVLVYVAMLFLSKSYRTIWIHAAMSDYLKTFISCIASGIVCAAGAVVMKSSYFYIKFSLVSMMLATLLIIGSRIAVKYGYMIVKQYVNSKNNRGKRNVLIIGAGSAAAVLLNDIKVNEKFNYNVVGLIDDDEKKINSYLNGVKVLGGRNDIVRVCEEYNVREIIVAIATIPAKEKQKILQICASTKCKVKTMPSIDEIIEIGASSQIRPVKIEDLLARDPVVLDDDGIKDIIQGKTIMVTGGGGSIGSELCRQLVKYKPEVLVIVDIYENNAYDLQNELISDYPNQKLEVLIASVRDKERLNIIFEEYHPDVVFHAAAHKHVPLMEYSPGEAIKNNVFGTYNVARCADEYGVSKFVMISTDKAVNPTNVMGATKRMCEFIVQAMQKVSKTQFVSVRFGNVLGSNGSVIPLFKRQIEKGGPVTVTHKDITRFFMTIPEAAQLVIQASCYAQGGEIFVLDMGEPVKIYNLAENIIRLSGYEPGKDMEIVVTGLRPGEKLYEELLMSEEGLGKTTHSKIFIGKQLDINMESLNAKLQLLKEAVETNDADNIVSALMEAVPTYKP